jgi:hypothetical protein
MALIAGIKLPLPIARGIAQPLRAMTAAMRTLAGGDTDVAHFGTRRPQ